MNRAYRHHALQLTDIQHVPIIKLTESLLPGWHLGIEHDADEFLTQLLQRLDDTVGCRIHIETVKITTICKGCKVDRNKERHQHLRISINLLQIQKDDVRIQDGRMKWSFEEKMRNCNSCGESIHEVYRVLVNPPTVLVIIINRVVSKKTLIGHNICK